MKKLVFLFLIAVFFTGCDKDEVVTINGVVQGYVVDLNTNEFLANANITYGLGADTITVTSNSSGYFHIEGLPVGYTFLTIRLGGYATTYQTVMIQPAYEDVPDQKNGGEYVVTTIAYVQMPALDADLKGTIKIQVGPNNQIRPAAGFTVDLQVGTDFYPSVYTTTTNSSGEYSFNNVPAGSTDGGPNALLVVKPAADSDNYYSDDVDVTLIPGSTVEVDVTINGVNTKGIYLISTNLELENGVYAFEFPVDEAITLTFSQEPSYDNTLNFGGITLPGSGVVFADDISFAGNTITITPPADLANATTYTLSYTVQSNTIGDATAGTITFTTEP